MHLLLTRSWKALQIVQLPKALGALQFFTGGRSNLSANISIMRNTKKSTAFVLTKPVLSLFL